MEKVSVALDSLRWDALNRRARELSKEISRQTKNGGDYKAVAELSSERLRMQKEINALEEKLDSIPRHLWLGDVVRYTGKQIEMVP